MATVGKGALRAVKNVALGYSDIQKKVRQATSNDPSGPSTVVLNDISQATYIHQDFLEVMEMLDRRLNDSGKNWRHVYKALIVLDYCLHFGSEQVVKYARDNQYIIKTLKEFQHVDDQGRDKGASVRQKAKDLTALLADNDRLMAERQNKSLSTTSYANEDDQFFSDHKAYPGRSSNAARSDDEDEDLKRAIEESKKTAEFEQRRRQEKGGLKTSYSDESLPYSRQAGKQNELILFDDSSYHSGDLVISSNNPYGSTSNQHNDAYQGPMQFIEAPSVEFSQTVTRNIVHNSNNPYAVGVATTTTINPVGYQGAPPSSQMVTNNPFGGTPLVGAFNNGNSNSTFSQKSLNYGGGAQSFGGLTAANTASSPTSTYSLNSSMSYGPGNPSTNQSLVPFSASSTLNNAALKLPPPTSNPFYHTSGSLSASNIGNYGGMNTHQAPVSSFGASNFSQQPFGTNPTFAGSQFQSNAAIRPASTGLVATGNLIDVGGNPGFSGPSQFPTQPNKNPFQLGGNNLGPSASQYGQSRNRPALSSLEWSGGNTWNGL